MILAGTHVPEGLAFTTTCAEMYRANPSGLACDKVVVEPDGHLRCLQDMYLLRPEVVESLFYAWRATHDPKWRSYARDIWNAIQRHCGVETGGFTDVKDVTRATPTQLDKQESWFLAETLKYLWLTFQSDDVVPLDSFVFTTEAHPLRRFSGL